MVTSFPKERTPPTNTTRTHPPSTTHQTRQEPSKHDTPHLLHQTFFLPKFFGDPQDQNWDSLTFDTLRAAWQSSLANDLLNPAFLNAPYLSPLKFFGGYSLLTEIDFGHFVAHGARRPGSVLPGSLDADGSAETAAGGTTGTIAPTSSPATPTATPGSGLTPPTSGEVSMLQAQAGSSTSSIPDREDLLGVFVSRSSRSGIEDGLELKFGAVGTDQVQLVSVTAVGSARNLVSTAQPVLLESMPVEKALIEATGSSSRGFKLTVRPLPGSLPFPVDAGGVVRLLPESLPFPVDEDGVFCFVLDGDSEVLTRVERIAEAVDPTGGRGGPPRVIPAHWALDRTAQFHKKPKSRASSLVWDDSGYAAVDTDILQRFDILTDNLLDPVLPFPTLLQSAFGREHDPSARDILSRILQQDLATRQQKQGLVRKEAEELEEADAQKQKRDGMINPQLLLAIDRARVQIEKMQLKTGVGVLLKTESDPKGEKSVIHITWEEQISEFLAHFDTNSQRLGDKVWNAPRGASADQGSQHGEVEGGEEELLFTLQPPSSYTREDLHLKMVYEAEVDHALGAFYLQMERAHRKVSIRFSSLPAGHGYCTECTRSLTRGHLDTCAISLECCVVLYLCLIKQHLSP